jgi:hypothetical protein
MESWLAGNANQVWFLRGIKRSSKKTSAFTPPQSSLPCQRRAQRSLRIVCQLQCLRLIPRCVHPDAALLVGRQDHEHSIGVDWLDTGVRRCRQETVDRVRAGYRPGAYSARTAPDTGFRASASGAGARTVVS